MGRKVIYKIRKTHPGLQFLGRTLILGLVLGAPLTIPKPLVYFLAFPIYGLEIIIWRSIRWQRQAPKGGAP